MTRGLVLVVVFVLFGCAEVHTLPTDAGPGCRTPSAAGVTRQLGNWPDDASTRCVCRERTERTDAGWQCRQWERARD